MRTYGRFGLLLAAVAALALLLLGPQEAAGSTTGPPDYMAALGDSITQAMDADGIPSHFGDQPWYSWSTGDRDAVQSHYWHIRHSYSGITGHNNNESVSGAKMVTLNTQALAALAHSPQPEYVTILMGANDVCTATEGSMTAVETYRTQFDQAMDTLTTALPNVRIFVASIPDIYQLWALLHDDPSVVAVWTAGSICQSLLANATSHDQADEDRRLRVQQRNIDFNTVLSDECATYSQCRFDNNVVFDGTLEVGDVSTFDYFHPSIAGQKKIAYGTWEATYDFHLPVGGVAELPDASDSSRAGYVVVAVLAGMAVVAFGAGGWLLRRRVG